MSVIIVLKIVSFLILFVLFFSLFQYMGKNKVIETTVETIYKKAQNSENMRIAREKRLILEEGIRKRKNIFYKLDVLIMSSRIQKIVPFLNTEVLIIFSSVFGSALGLVVFMITNLWITCMVMGIGGFLSFYFILCLMSAANYNKIENSLLEFTNLLENYSRTSDDIVSIIGHVAEDIREPLKTALKECQKDCMDHGITKALELLQRKVNHDLFNEIIRYIEIGASHEANYIEIMKGNREVLRSYYSARQERKAILDNGKREIGLLVMVFGFMLYVLKGLLTIDLFYLLISTLAGNLIIAYCIVVLFFCIYKLILFGRGK